VRHVVARMIVFQPSSTAVFFVTPPVPALNVVTLSRVMTALLRISHGHLLDIACVCGVNEVFDKQADMSQGYDACARSSAKLSGVYPYCRYYQSTNNGSGSFIVALNHGMRYPPSPAAALPKTCCCVFVKLTKCQCGRRSNLEILRNNCRYSRKQYSHQGNQSSESCT